MSQEIESLDLLGLDLELFDSDFELINLDLEVIDLDPFQDLEMLDLEAEL